MPHELDREGFLVSDDKALLDVPAAHRFLSGTYWSPGIPLETVRRGIEHSMAFGVYELGAGGDRAGRTQVGFGRVISDRATFAYLSDVFVVESHRGRGLSRMFMETVLSHPELQGLRRFLLLTRDAHGLYSKFGFKPLNNPAAAMDRWDPEVYRRGGTTGEACGECGVC